MKYLCVLRLTTLLFLSDPGMANIRFLSLFIFGGGVITHYYRNCPLQIIKMSFSAFNYSINEKNLVNSLCTHTLIKKNHL